MKTNTNQTIQTQGAELQIAEGGEREPTLIFLHYWGGSGRTWAPVIERLEDHIRYVAINQRGWGGSHVSDGRFDLEAVADDVETVISALGLRRYVLVGHSMGGKVAQIVAARRPNGLAGLVLVAPAPPTPMPVPAAQRADMLASYSSREGVLQALSILAGSPLSSELREQVIEDTLRGAQGAKQAWTDCGMIQDVSACLDEVSVPVSIIVGSNDQVEQGPVLQKVFNRFLPQSTLQTVDGAGHLLPLEAPASLATTCTDMLIKITHGENDAVNR